MVLIRIRMRRQIFRKILASLFVAANFRDIKKYLRLYGVRQVDGILADLGISSHQIDEPARGFFHTV